MELKTILVALLLLGLLAVGTVQAFQLMELKQKVAELEVEASKGSGGTSLQQSLNNLPTMVGGC